jgi:hypothetical protein
MFVVDDAIAAAIRTAYTESGVAAAVLILRRHIPGLDNDDEAGRWARTIAGWRPLPADLTPPAKKPRAPRK